ncbi:hypothetical protein CP556_03485 [Natrinema sp. CBA1119]|uniref:transcriptional regulator FilR1 domain-containing protein n=1 Tax=unclassified Natrinema TaxID=2622230 RepID=UPI000BF4653D|nr:hypothetical protein [Natrinema sp. CBA1119]PGF15283.1 hypothetical protein CP556_03485 [Natrinema sp. CBA1119]
MPPYGTALFDQRIGISGHNPVSGTVRALIDTDAPETFEWAESTYESYRRDSRPLVPEPTAE